MLAATLGNRLWRVLLISVPGLLCVSCGKTGANLHPVRGQVFFEGQPPEGATVVLRPVTDKAPNDVFPRGAVKADGSFTLECYELGSGAPEGEYVAVLMWYSADEKRPEKVVNKLPERYADQATSALLVTIKPGKNELAPFQLTR